MRHFEQYQRVKVTAIGHPLLGQTATVWRVHIRDSDAWIDMDCHLPDELRTFFWRGRRAPQPDRAVAEGL